MVRAGLGEQWDCLFSNDFDKKKRAIYLQNWQDSPNGKDIAEVTVADLPQEPSELTTNPPMPIRADLAWASFPCQDLSQAGNQLGLDGKRSGCFFPFWRLMRELIAQGRGPRVIAIENVLGTLNANEQKDVGVIAEAFAAVGYRFGFMIVDAVDFVPQSRPRFFGIGVSPDTIIPSQLVAAGPSPKWHPPGLLAAMEGFSRAAKRSWIWWNVLPPPPRSTVLADLIQVRPTGVEWHTKRETAHILALMNATNRAKVRDAISLSRNKKAKVIGAIYRRTRVEAKLDRRTGKITKEKRQRAEVRFDEVAGCLRTPVGGSSRQTIMVVSGSRIRTRLLSPREAVRLMGLPDSFVLPKNYNATYHFAGDGVVVPVVSFLRDSLLEPLVLG